MSAPRLHYELQALLNAEIPNAIVNLFNIPKEYFTNFKNLIGKTFILEAGIKSTPLTDRVGLKPPLSNTILRGFIVNVIGNPYTREGNQLTFFINPSPLSTSGNVLCEIKEGDSLKDKFKNALQALYPQAIITTTGTTITSNFKENIVFKSFSEVQERAKQNKILVFIDKQGFTIADTQTKPTEPIKLKATDFLEQPRMEDAVTITMSLFERGDIFVDSLIEIPDKLFQQVSTGINMLGVTPPLLLTGKFRVWSVWHRGDSRSLEGQSWALNLKAVKV